LTLSLSLLAGLYVVLPFISTWKFTVSRRNLTGPFDHLSTHCSHVPPISADEFRQRQQLLAETLHVLDATAYIAEPGANALFFGNISETNWHLSERPLLLLVSPRVSGDGAVYPQISILTPQFEISRAKMLAVPADNVTYPAWAEEANPYKVALSALPPSTRCGKIYVDGSLRHFVVDGFQKAAPNIQVEAAPVEIRRLRERKSLAELELLKCANEVRHLF